MRTRLLVAGLVVLAAGLPARAASAQDIAEPRSVCVANCDPVTESSGIHTDTSRADAERANDIARAASAFRRGQTAQKKGDARAAYQAFRTAADLAPGNAEYARARDAARQAYLDEAKRAREAANARANAATGALRQAEQAKSEGRTAVDLSADQVKDATKGIASQVFDTASRVDPAPVVVFNREPGDIGPALAPRLGINLNLNDPKNQPVLAALKDVAYMLEVVRTSATSGVRIEPSMLQQRVEKLNAALTKAEAPVVTTQQVETAYAGYRLGVSVASAGPQPSPAPQAETGPRK